MRGRADSRAGRRSPRPAAGTTLPELLAVLALAGLLAGIGAGALREGLGRARLRSAAAELVARMLAARWLAVSRGAAVGLRFEPEGDGYRIARYLDGDGDGIRTADIAAGRDVPFGLPYRPADERPGVRFGIPGTGFYPRVPPSRGVVRGGEDPIHFGSSGIVSFSPLGAATPGSVYLTDPAGRLAAVVLYGATVRIRVRFYDAGSGAWR